MWYIDVCLSSRYLGILLFGAFSCCFGRGWDKLVMGNYCCWWLWIYCSLSKSMVHLLGGIVRYCWNFVKFTSLFSKSWTIMVPA